MAFPRISLSLLSTAVLDKGVCNLGGFESLVVPAHPLF
jgi:hypothetical protein